MVGLQDIVFTVQQVPDPVYAREGDDLIVNLRIHLSLALCEGKIDVPHLDGRTLRVPLKEVRPPACQSLALQRLWVAWRTWQIQQQYIWNQSDVSILQIVQSFTASGTPLRRERYQSAGVELLNWLTCT